MTRAIGNNHTFIIPRLGRSSAQWNADVLNVFAGLDRGGGVVTVEDFRMALHLLSCTMSAG